MSKNIEKAIIVKNKTRLELLTQKFNTMAQAKFYISQSNTNFYSKKSVSEPPVQKMQSQSSTSKKKSSNQAPVTKIPQAQAFDDYEEEHNVFYKSLDLIQEKISKHLKVKVVERSFLPNYIFSENDLVIAVGQDGLVANTAKYLNNIPLIGINPDTNRYDGILLPFNTSNFEAGVLSVLQERYRYNLVTMAEAKLNDGQKLLAFNDLFIGPSTHASARYKISYQGITENQSSSGIIVSTGAGSTGWLSSLFNMANGITKIFNPQQTNLNQQKLAWDENQLIFVVREPFQSKYSQIDLSAGTILNNNELIIESLMPDNGIIFSDGIEADFLKFNSGAIATIKIAAEKAKLVLR